MKATAEQPKKGWSFARLLVLVAVIGITAGTILGAVVQPEVNVEEQVEAEMRRVMPRGEPLNVDNMEPDPTSLRGIPPYPGVYPRRLVRKSATQDVPMSVSWFSVKDPARGVLDFYEKAFTAEGRRPVKQLTGPDMGYVAWLEELPDAGPGGGIMHMVSAMKQFSETIVLVSASRPDLTMGLQVPLPEGIELPPASTTPQVVQMGEEAIADQVFYSRTVNMSPAEVVRFFEAQFKLKGFTVTETANSAAHASLTGQREGATLIVAARAEGGDSSVVLTYERRRAEPEQ